MKWEPQGNRRHVWVPGPGKGMYVISYDADRNQNEGKWRVTYFKTRGTRAYLIGHRIMLTDAKRLAVRDSKGQTNVKNNPQTDFGVAGNPRHVKRDKRTGRFVSERRKSTRKRRKNSLGTSALSYIKESGANPGQSINVFRAKTRGGKYEIVATKTTSPKRGTSYTIAEYVGGDVQARSSGHNLQSVQKELRRRILSGAAYDNINYKVVVDKIGVVQNPRKRRKNSAVRTAKPKTISRTQLALGRNNPGTVDDQRADKSEPYAWVVGTDEWMSRWGKSPGTSYFAIAARDEVDVDNISANMKRQGQKRVRRVKKLPRLKTGDHISVRDETTASVYYKVGGFSDNPLNKTNRRWKGPHKGPGRKVRKASPQWWKISKYRKNGKVMGHHIGQGTVRQAKAEAAKLSEARGVHKVVLRGPYKTRPMKGKR